jgi:hypothetical protein
VAGRSESAPNQATTITVDDIQGEARSPDLFDDSAVHEFDESPGTRCGWRHCAQNAAAAARRLFEEVWNKGNVGETEAFLAPKFISRNTLDVRIVEPSKYGGAVTDYRGLPGPPHHPRGRAGRR